MALIDRESLLEKIQFRSEPYGVVGETIKDCVEKTREIILAEPIADNLSATEWIPVTERLPEKDGDYLVFKELNRNKWCDVVSFAKDGRKVSKCTFEKKWQNIWYYYDSEWGYIRTDCVAHWMPLPEPPKEVE